MESIAYFEVLRERLSEEEMRRLMREKNNQGMGPLEVLVGSRFMYDFAKGEEKRKVDGFYMSVLEYNEKSLTLGEIKKIRESFGRSFKFNVLCMGKVTGKLQRMQEDLLVQTIWSIKRKFAGCRLYPPQVKMILDVSDI